MSTTAQTPQKSELENRILYFAALPAGVTEAQIVYAATGLPPGSLLFPDVLYVAQTLRKFVGASRALGPQDMTTPETDAASAGGAVNIADLQTRASAAVNASLTNDLAALTSAPTADAIRATLV